MKKIIDWVVHLEYLQAALKEFHVVIALNKNFLIWYFWNGFKPSIYAQFDKWDKNSKNWQEIIIKTIDAKAKAGQQPFFSIQQNNTHHSRGHWPIKSDKSSK